QSVLKEIKPSTRQRFVALEFDYPAPEEEAVIVAAEGGVDMDLARRLVKLGGLTRNLKGQGLDEGASTRLLVHAAQLVAAGIAADAAAVAAIARALTDDPDMTDTLGDLVRAVF
ncbi:partial Denitrification regulatory protein NirQ, partial [Rhodocyclaceae bacterium]